MIKVHNRKIPCL